MTLFRKVFPNQSRPATEEESLNEDAVRSAFKEMNEAKEPLVLDPFEHAVADSEDTAEDYDAQLAYLEQAFEDEIPESEMDKTDAFDFVHPGDVVASACDERAEHDAVQQPVPSVKSDEEIAACLDRAKSAEPDAPSPDTTDGDATDVGEPHLDADHIGDAHAEVRSELGAEMLPDARSREFDAVAFARAQMSALEATQTEAATLAEAAAPSNDTEKLDLSQVAEIEAVPAPAPGRVGRRAGRAKTRLLGFNRADDTSKDPFGGTQETTATAQREKFPVGWLVIVEGPGVGHSFSIFTGASMIGRGDDQVIRLDFGDNSISRNNHAAVAYDEEQNKFYIGHGGKSNIIRRNARPVLSTEELHHADLIRIGETTLRFVALCGSDFKWQTLEGDNV